MLGFCDCRRDDDKTPRMTVADRRAAGEPIRGKSTCGLGITFREDMTGALAVHSLLEGGAGRQSGALQPGDILVDLDGHKVDLLQPELLATISQGVEGSSLVAGFQRPPHMTYLSVTLIRSVPTEAFS